MPFGTLVAVSEAALSVNPTWHFVYNAYANSEATGGDWGLLFRFIPTNYPDQAVEFGFKGTWVGLDEGSIDAAIEETYVDPPSAGSSFVGNTRFIPGTESQYMGIEAFHTQFQEGSNYWSSISIYAPGSLEPHIGTNFTAQTSSSGPTPGAALDIARLGPGSFELYELGSGLLTFASASITFEEGDPPSNFWTAFTLCSEA